MAFENDLGTAVSKRHKDGATCVTPLHPGLYNGQGVLHGGVIASIADEVAWHAIIAVLGKEAPMTTNELKVNYLRPVVGRKAIARGYVLKIGKMLAVTRVDVMDEQRRLAAHATVSYAFLR
jgi:uncharacterized protein (TIGR00369 family)